MLSHGRVLTGVGKHFCSDWDMMPIDQTCPDQWSCCLCDKPNINEGLVKALREMLQRAEDGQLQSLAATGFTNKGHRFVVWSDSHPNVYEFLGALSFMEHEYKLRAEQRAGAPC